jgi:hypothetical protein
MLFLLALGHNHNPGVTRTMQGTLTLMCATPNKRPRRVTDEMALTAALEVAEELMRHHNVNGPAEEIAEQILDVTRYDRLADGYEIGRDLERRYCWDMSRDLVEALDSFSSYCSNELDRAVKKWGEENPMEPPFPLGTKVETRRDGIGVLAEISKYSPATYLVKVARIENGLLNVAFEDAKPVCS